MQETKNAKQDRSTLPPPILISTLVIKNHESFHFYKESDQYIDSIDKIREAINNTTEDENNPKVIPIQLGLSPDSFTYKNFKKNLYFENAMLIFTKVKIHDNLPNFKWTIIPNETKKIGSYLCKKATIRYRDDLNIVWFTDEIPISNGPYEFGGLPGLILQIENSDQRISATKIIAKSTDFAFDFPEVPNKKPEMLSLASYNEEDRKITERMREDAKAGKPLIINLNKN